jgi:hypothetical protein
MSCRDCSTTSGIAPQAVGIAHSSALRELQYCIVAGTDPPVTGTALLARGISPSTKGTAPPAKGISPSDTGTAPLATERAQSAEGTTLLATGTAPSAAGIAPSAEENIHLVQDLALLQLIVIDEQFHLGRSFHLFRLNG